MSVKGNESNMTDWTQSTVMGFDKESKGGNGDGIITEDEFIKAASEASGGQISEDTARNWFKDLHKASGSDEEGINFKRVPESKRNDIASFFERQGREISVTAKADNAINLPGAFEKMDEKGNGEVTKNEFRKYVSEKMPGGDLLGQADIDTMFKIFSGGDNEEGGNVITKDEFENTTVGDSGESFSELISRHVDELTYNPPSPEQKMIEAINQLIETLQQQQQSESTDEFKY